MCGIATASSSSPAAVRPALARLRRRGAPLGTSTLGAGAPCRALARSRGRRL